MKQLRGNFILFVLSLQLAFLPFFIRASIRNCFHSPATSFASIFEILFEDLTISPCTILARRFSVVQQTQRVGIDVILRLHIHARYLRELWPRMFAHLAELNSFFVFCGDDLRGHPALSGESFYFYSYFKHLWQSVTIFAVYLTSRNVYFLHVYFHGV